MTITLREVDRHFLKLIDKEITINDFENWLYKDEIINRSQCGDDLYFDLISLNYNTSEAKHELSKLLSIDYIKLRKFQIQNIILDILKLSELKLENVKFGINYESPIVYGFEVGKVKFSIENPFIIDNFGRLENDIKQRLFVEKFLNVRRFLVSILNALTTDNIRVFDGNGLELMDSMAQTKAGRANENEYEMYISNHLTFINKAYIREAMQADWL